MTERFSYSPSSVESRPRQKDVNTVILENIGQSPLELRTKIAERLVNNQLQYLNISHNH